jgi:acyl-CoA hydrolase
MTNYVSGEEAVRLIKPGHRVYIHGGAATPHFLLQKLVERADELWDVELVSISTQGEAPYADKKYKQNFKINSLFVSQNIREAVNDDRGDYIPVFLSEIPNLFKRNILLYSNGTFFPWTSLWFRFLFPTNTVIVHSGHQLIAHFLLLRLPKL